MPIAQADPPASIAEPAAPPPMSALPPAGAGPPGVEVFPVRFSGTGGGYFRVWLANLLLLVVTFGVYTPWARRRTVRWFYDHTEVAGSPLEFAAPLRRMVFGFLVFSGLYLAYEIASRTGQHGAALAMAVGTAVLAPAAWASAMRFRTASTRWRGLQLRFSAGWAEVYRASWPVLGLVAIAATGYVTATVLFPDDVADTPAHLASLRRDLGVPLGIGLVVAILAGVALLVRLEYGYRRLLFQRGGLGAVDGRFKPGWRAYLRITFAALVGWILLVGLSIGGLILLWAATLAGAHGAEKGAFGGVSAGALAGVVIAVPLCAWVCAAPVLAWREARLFSIVWNGVGLGRIVRTQCTLSTGRFVRLRIVNVVLTLVTLGLWRPFARVREYRMKVESVRLHVRGGLDGIEGRLVAAGGGVGDMIADAAGFDVIG